MPSVVAKFQVNFTQHYTHSTKVDLSAVHATPESDPKSENYKFWQASPMGHLEITINNLDAAEFFQPGDTCYLTFEKADG